MNALLYLIVNGLAVYVSAYLLKGVHVAGFFVAIVVAVVLGLVNLILKPILILLTLPLNILTLGIFTLIINGIMVLLVTWLVPGFSVDSLWWGVLFSIVMSFVSSFFNWLRRE